MCILIERVEATAGMKAGWMCTVSIDERQALNGSHLKFNWMDETAEGIFFYYLNFNL